MATRKTLVKRLGERPFALVGVNGDSDKAELQREIRRHGITWRSWWDADAKISTRWQAQSLPTIFVIDHKGIIRQRYTGLVRGNVLSAAVEALLKECEQQTAQK